MTIKEVSEKFKLTPDTLRYYERVNLIPKIKKNKRGIRDYSEDDCNWIEFIKCMREAGIPIEALIEYVQLYFEGDITAEARKDILIEQKEIIEEKVEFLKGILERLTHKIDYFYGDIKSKKYDYKGEKE